MKRPFGGLFAAIAFCATMSVAAGAEVKILTAGAIKPVLQAVEGDFRTAATHTMSIQNDTVGASVKKIEGGAAFDVAILTPAAIDDLAGKGFLVAGSRTVLARVGVGVMVKAGAPQPDVSNVEAFKRTLLAAKSVAYIDPASGGSSGIYVARLFERLGIADQIKPKAKLKQGGHVADLVVSGEAEIGIHQISEIVTVSGVTLVGPLPAEIQNYTVYAAGLGAKAPQPDAASALIKFLGGPVLAPVLKAKGMDAPASDGNRDGEKGGMQNVKALFFDVFGTLVDWRSSIAREAQAILGPLGHQLDWPAFADAWRAEYDPAMQEIRSGKIPFCKLDLLHRRNLDIILPRFGITALDEATARHLNLAWHRLDAWPDTSLGLKRLKRKFAIAPCSNGNISLMVGLARRNDLPWDAILGSEIAHDFKPKPRVYLAACEALDLPPAQCMMVAAHPRDLAHAASHGLRTGFVARPNE